MLATASVAATAANVEICRTTAEQQLAVDTRVL